MDDQKPKAEEAEDQPLADSDIKDVAGGTSADEETDQVPVRRPWG